MFLVCLFDRLSIWPFFCLIYWLSANWFAFCLLVPQSVCLLTRQSVHMSDCLFFCLSTSLSDLTIWLINYLFVYLTSSLSICTPSVCLFVYLTVCLSACLSVSQSIYQSVWLFDLLTVNQYICPSICFSSSVYLACWLSVNSCPSTSPSSCLFVYTVACCL